MRRDPEVAQKVTQKKEQNTADILAHMEKNRDKVCLIIDAYLDALLSPAKIASATTSQLTTALGTLIDKFTAISSGPGMATEEDGLSRSLREMGKELKSDD